MKRYVILAKENWPGAVIREICRCETNAKVIRDALADYTVTGSQGTRIYKFNHVEILEISRRKPREARAQMKKAIRNVDSFSGKPSANQILTVIDQIEVIRKTNDLRDAMRAGNGEQAAPQGPAAEDRPALSQRKTEAEP